MESYFPMISFVTGVVSIVLAIVAIWISKSAERESRENYEKTKDVLAEINKSAAVIETTVSANQQQLLETVTTILKETAVPEKVSMQYQAGMMLLKAMLENPKNMSEMVQSLQSLSETNNGQQKP
ncbi:MAG: hypothetical protein F4Y44_03705 [Chloroflexi bacterium]|nr:hypothetical protein [Chloroflexota bacterium]